MAIRINTPQTINGQDYPGGMLVVGLDAREEEQLAQGGGAARVNLPPVSGYGLSAITNAAALKPFAEYLPTALTSEVYVTGTGDSLFQFGGDNPATPPSSDTLAERDGFLAQFRAELNRLLSTPDGGQWISAEAAVSDTRVTNTGTTPINQFGPYNAYNNGAGTITQRRAQSLTGAAQAINFIGSGRYLYPELWENAGTYVGTMNWADSLGAASGVIASNGGGGATDTYRSVKLDLLTAGAHNIAISWASLSNLLTGADFTFGTGVVTRRFGYGGSKAATWAGLTAKQIRTSFNTRPTHLHIIRLSYNDWNNQVADGLTIAAFKTSVQTLIDAALVNTSVLSVLLVADPVSSTADNKPISYRAFSNALRDLALSNNKVAFYDVDLATNGTFASGNAAGYYVDFVHRTRLGYGAEGRILAQAIYGMSRVSI